jgi:hypothetical protein
MTTSSANPQTSNSLADLADLTARIRAKVVDGESAYRAAKTCGQCAKCGNTLPVDTPVWRQHLRPHGRGVFGGARCVVAPVCERCRSDEKEFRGPRPCENCGRAVHQEYSRHRYRRTFCCQLCERAVRVAAAKQERSDARSPRQCECGETFEPTRADAQFCSSRCRQRAYRKRTALRMLDGDHCEPFISRNATDSPWPPPDPPPQFVSNAINGGRS